MAYDIEYTSIDDVLSTVGGLFTSIVGVGIWFYDMIFGFKLKKKFAKKIYQKAQENEDLLEIVELSGSKIEFKENQKIKEFMFEVGEMNSFSYNWQSHLYTEAFSKIIKKHEIRFAEQE